MKLQWTDKAVSDIIRLHQFLSPSNKIAADKSVQSLVKAPLMLIETPRIGDRLCGFEPHEVRRLLVQKYEIRYEIRDQTIYILRVWHTRENR
ncbi:type II toxin-antitoxin system RelE/ParE family toxin [Candidatus Finniella inopinata]|uniref:Type II toxin-antitoxin system RelE/ParE family toxin n=1 Tax=Candidatus Finniella inopinata TaxID=1696036 RepID=A0A4Q7DKA3_9PROT|nr:type II toxin-antitoxin system RelE/ParE family toxin [Candidatus Finniella inopinata]RZI46625.1 type II toxin-antitoxin system RelE/ParE family toxin [Candidatus Finniella inopinata]